MTTKINGKQWANIHLDWPLNSEMPRKEAVARFRLKTRHECLATHLHKIKVYSSEECTLCRIQGTSMNADHLLNCRIVQHKQLVTPQNCTGMQDSSWANVLKWKATGGRRQFCTMHYNSTLFPIFTML
jgi:hypothetical protein